MGPDKCPKLKEQPKGKLKRKLNKAANILLQLPLEMVGSLKNGP